MVLFQPVELLIIGGAAGSSLLISASPPTEAIIKISIRAIKGASVSKRAIEAISCLFELLIAIKSLGVGPQVDDPSQSSIFTKYPGVLNNHHALDLIADTMKVMLSGHGPYDLEDQ